MAQSDNFYSKKTSVFWAFEALSKGRIRVNPMRGDPPRKTG
jgi:hypothetical protein